MFLFADFCKLCCGLPCYMQEASFVHPGGNSQHVEISNLRHDDTQGRIAKRIHWMLLSDPISLAMLGPAWPSRGGKIPPYLYI